MKGFWKCPSCEVFIPNSSEHACPVEAVRRLTAALKRYGEHHDTCEVIVCGYNREQHADHEQICACDCGLDAALANDAPAPSSTRAPDAAPSAETAAEAGA